MALLRFRKITLTQWNQLTTKDPNTRFTVYDSQGNIYGEFIGNKPVFAHVKGDGRTIVTDENGNLKVSDNLVVDGGYY